MEKIEIIRSKILDAENLDRKLAYWRFKEQKIVFTNGCFDLIHLGHIDYLAKAADFGNILFVGLNTDNSVRKLKGIHRPINNQEARAMALASLSFVTAVMLFDQDTPYELIKKVQPDILVKGADYAPEKIVGYDIVKAKNGEIITISLTEGYSTTAIEEKIRNLQR
jgi:rfaE bifunctional protein nucleotidyltransferase chain/domain